MTRRPRGAILTTRLGLGLAALGRPGYINLGHGNDLGGNVRVEHLRANAFAVLDAAYDAGIRYFDAARSYGRAEAFLADWLEERRIAPADVVVGSKWGYVYTAGWRVDAEKHEVKDHSLPNFLRQLSETRALLGEHLALYQVHSATLESGVLKDEAVLRTLAELSAQGVTVGLSLSGSHQTETLHRAMECRVDGQQVFSCVQATWNLLEQTAAKGLAAAAAEGWDVIVKEALANGLLTERNPALRGSPLDELARVRGVGMDTVALAAALAQPWATVVLSGAATVEQLQSNLRATEFHLQSDELLVLQRMRESSEAYWKRRSQLSWN